jgi:hypothetical protein
MMEGLLIQLLLVENGPVVITVMQLEIFLAVSVELAEQKEDANDCIKKKGRRNPPFFF